MKTVLLTGITGFIAKRIAHDLLEKRYHVRGSLRSAKRADEVRAVVGDASNLSFVELDLTKDAGWTEAMDGVDVLMHTASPFPIANPKDEQQVIGPAVGGTMRALHAAQAAGVNRVVLTSSMVAMMYVDRPKGHRFGPEDWTEVNHLTANAYIKSKTLAEKAAWDFVKAHPEMKMTTIHPGLVCGTPMDIHYGSSLEVIERLWSGKDPMSPMIWLPVVDIADVSALHIAAMENDASIGERVVATDDTMAFPQMAEALKELYPQRKIATKVAPKMLLSVLSLFDRDLKSVLPQVGREVLINNDATEKLFDFTFIPGKDAARTSAKFINAHKG
ncbi:MAG: NAD-dependent epimerase/dehydratase family protein [Arenicellales bacterium]|nr:NAD-dependent epimerase/dehydratase family protein [Arenicellales bacterium]